MKDFTVIDDRLISGCCKYEEGQEENSHSYSYIIELIFSYKRIIKIQNLEGLVNLETLKLDNNLIENIEGLDFLPKLKILDLSFNKIGEVKNLDKLFSLEQLSLYSNQIKGLSADSLKRCSNLTILSLSHNLISDLPSLIKSLKVCNSLSVLSLKGNPLTSDDEHKNFVIANLPDLKYFDYIFINESMKQMADDSKYLIEGIGSFEGKEGGKDDVEGNEETMVELRKLNLICYEKYLLSGNHELSELLSIKTCFEDSIQKLSDNMKGLVESIRYQLNEVLKERKQITSKYESATKNMVLEGENEKDGLINSYFHSKKRVTRLFDLANRDQNELKEVLAEIRKQLEIFDESITESEMILKANLRKAYHQMETNFKNIYSNIEQIIMGENGVKNVEEFLNEFFNKFIEEGLLESDRMEQYFFSNQSQESLPEDSNNDSEKIKNSPWTEEQIAILENKDELKNTINTFKEWVENKHRTNESLIRRELATDKQNYLLRNQVYLKELNRKNINNILKFIDEEEQFWNSLESELSLNRDNIEISL